MFEFQTVSVTFRANFVQLSSGHEDMLQVPGCREKRTVDGETDTRTRECANPLVKMRDGEGFIIII